MCVFFSEQRMAHSPNLIFNAIAEKKLQQNPFPPAEDFKLLPLILLVSACSSSTRERGEKPNQKVTITTGGREGPKSNIPSISTMGFSTLILSKAMAASKDDNEDNSCRRRSNKGLTKELTNSEREIERSWACKSAKKNPFSIRRWEAKDTEKQMQTKLADLADRRPRKRTVKGRGGRRRRRRVCAPWTSPSSLCTFTAEHSLTSN